MNRLDICLSGYIDIHNHILPGLDDGPRTMNEAVMLARAMVAAGYDTVIATPHTFEGKPAPTLVNERLEELQEELIHQKVPLIILPGSEPHIEPGIPTLLEKGELQTLNNSRYFFVELPFSQPLPPYTEQLLFELTAKGYQPIIPHPERAEALQKDPDLIHRLHRTGALFQLTWGALTGWLGPDVEKTARYLIEANLAHLFATDAHNAASRLLTVEKSAAILDKLTAPGTATQMLTTRPRQLLNDQPLDL
jgi:protein-tyrosine phosphatase